MYCSLTVLKIERFFHVSFAILSIVCLLYYILLFGKNSVIGPPEKILLRARDFFPRRCCNFVSGCFCNACSQLVDKLSVESCGQFATMLLIQQICRVIQQLVKILLVKL